MIAGEYPKAIGQMVLESVSEAVAGARGEDSAAQRPGQQAVEGDAAEADHDAEVFEQAHFLVQPGRAVAELFGSGLIARRSAARHRGDPQIAEAHAIVAGESARLRRKACLVKNGKQEIA